MIYGEYMYIFINTIHIIHIPQLKIFQCTSNVTSNTYFTPQDLTLRLLLAQRYELGDSPLPSSQLEAADDAYRILGTGDDHDDLGSAVRSSGRVGSQLNSHDISI